MSETATQQQELQPDSDDVLSVEREVVPDRDSSPRPKREVFTHASILPKKLVDLVGFEDRAGVGISNGAAADRSTRQ